MSKMANIPRVGVGVIVVNNNKVLLGKRINAHGDNTWNFPGGHLEFGESLFDCAKREVREEVGIEISDLEYGPYTNDIFEKENKHYITIFIIARSHKGEPQVLEPDKCLEWQWFEWSSLPQPLFLPIQNLLFKRYSPINV